MQNMSVDAVFPYLTYEKWWHFYICQYGKKWPILPCIFSCVCCTATEIIRKDCSHWEKPFDMQNMCVDCVFAYLTIWRVMTFLHLPILQKVTYFALHFELCVLYCNKIYMKRLLSQRRSFWYAKHVCRCCISLFDIWKVMTFLYLEIWQKMTYFALYFQLCALYCNRNYMKSLLSLRETFWYAKHVCRLCICLPHIWRVMTFLHLLILPKVTYFALHFQLCVLYCKKIIWKDCSHREEAFDMQNMSVDAVFPYLTYEKWWHFYIWKYGKKWHIFPCIFSCVRCTATEIIWKDCSHWEKPFDTQNMCVDCVFAYLTYEEWWHFYIS